MYDRNARPFIVVYGDDRWAVLQGGRDDDEIGPRESMAYLTVPRPEAANGAVDRWFALQKDRGSCKIAQIGVVRGR